MTKNKSVISMAKTINSRQDFVLFLQGLSKDLSQNPSDWENDTLERFIEAMAAWVNDMDGYYKNLNAPIPENVDWKILGQILLAATMYE
jgi:hypothetical protein